jgi:hypothetical protein
MNYSAISLVLIVVPALFLAGCTQSSGTGPLTPALPATTVPMPEMVMPVLTTAETSAPREVVTIIRYVSQARNIKDSELLFTLQVPVEWNVSTHQLINSDTSDYLTDLGAGTVFSIYTYPVPRSQEQAYRDEFRQWSPAPRVTTVTVNDITYDRFESTSEGKTKVSYVVRKGSANERGYASVLVFTARDSNRFEKEEFEKVVSSFRYFGGRSAKTEPGEEIPLYDWSGNEVSRKVGGGSSLAWGEWEGDSGDSPSGGSSGADSSAGSSSGGCGCGG